MLGRLGGLNKTTRSSLSSRSDPVESFQMKKNAFTALTITFDVDHSGIGHGCRAEEVACFWEGGLEEIPQLLP